MKHKLLSLMALIGAMFMSASAMAWEKPAKPSASEKSWWTAPEIGGVYYLYNVGAEQFLGAGNNWGTHVITMACTDETIFYAKDAKKSLGGGENDKNKGIILPVEVLKGENDNFLISHLGSNREDNKRYLTSEEGNSWIDGDDNRKGTFTITAVEGGYNIVATNASDAFYGVPSTSTDSVNSVYSNLTKDDKIVWLFAKYDIIEVYTAKFNLYSILLKAEEAGISTAEAGTVYNNAAATAEEVKAATEKLEAAIRAKEMADTFGEASLANPMDVTSFVLKNADFNSGNVDGWDLGFTKGENCTNLGYQGAKYPDKNGNIKIEKFIEAWQRQPDKPALGDGYISQTVTGLPNGKYKLEVDVIAVNQADAKTPAEGVYLFIKADDNEEKTLIQTENGISEHITTYLDIEDATKVTFGLKTENTTANWMAADNFKVTYFGTSKASREYIALYETIKNSANGTQVAIANADTIDLFNTIYEDALQVDENADAETCNTANANLTAAYNALMTSKEEYLKVMPYVDAANTFAEELKTLLIDYEDLVNDIIDLAADWQEGYDNLSLTSADIAAMEGAAIALFKENVVAENIKVGADLTFLLNNADFMEGEFGPNRTGDQVKGWTITGTLTELRKATENIENYHSVFSIKQTIANMPAGVYDITVQGFVRHDGEITNGTKFFAGNTSTELISLKDNADQASDVKIFKNDTNTEEKGDGNQDVAFAGNAEKFQCNGMTGAYYWFRTENPITGENYYTNHIKAVLTKNGDFTIGVESTIDKDWVIWGNFNIKYNGMDEEALRIMLDQGIAELQEMGKDQDMFITKEGLNKIDNAIETANNALSAEEMMEASQVLATVKDYLIDGDREGKAMRATASSYLALEEKETTTFDKRNSEDGQFVELIAKYEGYTGQDVKDNEEIATIVKDMNDQWIARVQKGSEVATKAEPFNVTPVIKNHTFQDVNDKYTYDGWTVVKGGVAANFNALEAFNKDSVDVNQTISGLKPGFYTIDMRGMYRAGDLIPANSEFQKTGKQNYKAFLYGRTHYDEQVEKFDSAWVHHIQSTLEGMQTGVKDTPFFAKDEETGQIADAVIYTIDTTFCQKTDEGAFAVRYDSISADSVDGKLVIKYDTIYANKLDTIGYTYAPNSMKGFMTWVNDGKMLDADGNALNLYHNTIGVEVFEDGKLQLGFRKFGKLANDWLITGDWRLYYLGQGEENRPDGIVLNERTLKSIGQQFYSIDGRRMATLRRGVNIVRETLSDGTTRTRKVLVK